MCSNQADTDLIMSSDYTTLCFPSCGAIGTLRGSDRCILLWKNDACIGASNKVHKSNSGVEAVREHADTTYYLLRSVYAANLFERNGEFKLLRTRTVQTYTVRHAT